MVTASEKYWNTLVSGNHNPRDGPKRKCLKSSSQINMLVTFLVLLVITIILLDLIHAMWLDRFFPSRVPPVRSRHLRVAWSYTHCYNHETKQCLTIGKPLCKMGYHQWLVNMGGWDNHSGHAPSFGKLLVVPVHCWYCKNILTGCLHMFPNYAWLYPSSINLPVVLQALVVNCPISFLQLWC